MKKIKYISAFSKEEKLSKKLDSSIKTIVNNDKFKNNLYKIKTNIILGRKTKVDKFFL